MSIEQAIIGIGWQFPPGFVKQGKNTVLMSGGVDDIEESLTILLSTSLGERVMQHNYGSDLSRLLFEPLNATLEALVKDIILTAVNLYEPRISIIDINLESLQAEGILNISLDYTVIAVNSRLNFVFPLYLNEASNPNQ